MYEEELFLLSKPLRLFFLQLCKRSLYTHQQHPSLRGRKIFQVIRTLCTQLVFIYFLSKILLQNFNKYTFKFNCKELIPATFNILFS